MAKKPIKVTEVVLRDAHQSLLATRMTMDEMRPILPEMDKINYFSVECWGGATFDSCIRFLDEDPWERLRILRKELPHQKLQMLFRGQNMLGYRPYADDAVEYFVQKSVANGIDVIRIFDALNDPRNLQTAIKSANKEGAHVQGCISYTLSPVHNNEYFAAYAKTLEEMGANSICIKDMAGLLTPYTCYDLVKKLKETVSIPVDIHSHYTAGLASMSILKGIEAGADIIDTAMSPLSLGTSHMPTESLVAALQGTDYDTGLDLKQLNVVRAYFAKLREKYIANGQISPKSLGVDANTLLYQVPGGMFSNMLKQLKDAGKEDKLDEVLADDPRTMEPVYVPKNPHEKAMQRALIQYRNPANYELVKEALLKAHRSDLIGFDAKCLIRPRPDKNRQNYQGTDKNRRGQDDRNMGGKNAGRKNTGNSSNQNGRNTAKERPTGKKKTIRNTHNRKKK